MTSRIKYLKPEHGYTPEDGIDANGVYGWYLGRCLDNEFINNQLVSDPRFIVIDDNGFVDIVYPTHVRFLDTPTDRLIVRLFQAMESDSPKNEIIKTVHGFFETEV
jgi:hypothetical protein